MVIVHRLSVSDVSIGAPEAVRTTPRQTRQKRRGVDEFFTRNRFREIGSYHTREREGVFFFFAFLFIFRYVFFVVFLRTAGARACSLARVRRTLRYNKKDKKPFIHMQVQRQEFTSE